MKALVSKFIFFVLGWKIIGKREIPKKAIVISAPHTSSWDFIIGRCYAYILKLNAKYLIKKELFFPFIGWLFKINGGIPVNRDKNKNLVNQVVDLFRKHNRLILGVAPEGTRKKVDKWKTGFYYMATESKVPILLCVMDYKKKEIGIVEILYPSGDFNDDFKIIEDIFRDVHGKNIENYNSKIF